MMADDPNFMPSVMDREIGSTEADAFGHRHYAHALRSLIESDANPPPFSIGLLGGWGTGKSSIKQIYMTSLANDLAKDESGKARSKKFHVITFNAWRFGGEDIKRALLRHVFLGLGGDEGRLKRELFGEVTRLVSEPRKLREWMIELAEKRGGAVLLIAILFGLVVLAVWITKSALGIENNDWTAAITVAYTIALPFLLDKVLRFEPIPRHTSITSVELPSATAEQYEDLLIEQIGEYKQGRALDRRGASCERLVVFVDDLDRLSAEEMVSGLDAIRAFMEIPQDQLPRGLGIVFVISCDEERVAHALANGRGRGRSADLPASVFTRSDARRFLDRIFQYRLEIPQFPKRDMRQYVLGKFDELGSIAVDLKSRGVALEILVDRMIHVGVQSPRNALQILNAFAQSWWLALVREAEGAATERAGGLHEGAVTRHPMALAALCALRVDFPEFYDELQTEPDLIRRFSDVLLRGHPIEDMPEATREILAKYLSHDPKDETNRWEIRKEHRPLRRFIASLQTMRWPASLQPLLLLTQDPVTRKYGDRAPRLYEAFVSGDLDGVLEELGRELDRKPLRPQDVQLLRDMGEDLARETEARRDNAAVVLAGLTDRLPVDQARIIVGPLARQLGESPELRWRVGVAGIRRVLELADADDRKDIASKLIAENLRTGSVLAFRLESGEPPNLDEAVEIARDSCSLALWVRKEEGLPELADRELLEWLEARSVKADTGRAHDLPFAELDRWMDEHEEHLLPSLGERYADQLIGQFESEAAEELDVAVAMKRLGEVFGRLWDLGEESRRTLWAQLTRLVAVRSQEAVALSWDFTTSHLSSPDAVEISGFVENLALRLDKEMRDQKEWKLDWQGGGKAIISLLEGRLADCDEDAGKAIVALINVWSEVKDTGDFANQGLGLLLAQERSEAAEVVANWTSRILGDLADRCVVGLADRYVVGLSDQQRRAITSQLNAVAQTDNVEERIAAKYRLFVGSLSGDALDEVAMQEHFQTLFPTISQRFQNPNDYLKRLFPVVPATLAHSPPGVTGQMLHGLFTQAKGNRKVYGWLHGEMASHWPKADTPLDPYTPVQLFDEAINFANSRPNEQIAWGIIDSLRSMIEGGVVPRDKIPRLAEATCAVWQHHGKETLRTLQWLGDALQPQQVAGLMDGIDAADEITTSLLREIWHHITSEQSRDQFLETSRLLLQRPPAGSEEDPDQFLSIWMDSPSEAAGEVARTLLVDSQLNDEQRRRLWIQVENKAELLDADFLVDALPKILALNGGESTARAVFESKAQINDIFSTKDARASLGESLVGALPAATTKTIKVEIAKWIREIGGQAALRKIGDGMGEDDLEILRQEFPQDRSLGRALKKMRQNQ